MNRLRREDGLALVNTIMLVAIMVALGTALLAVVDTQSAQTRQERVGEEAFNLAEATLNAEAFVLGRNWPQNSTQVPTPSAAAAPCSGQTVTGTLAEPAPSATPSVRDQVQSILAETYEGTSSTAQWWVTACETDAINSWHSSLLNGKAYDPSVAASPTPQARRMWVRAESDVNGRRRAVVAMVQAGQQPVFPTNLAVVTGELGADLTTTTGQLVTGNVVNPLVSSLVGGGDPVIDGPIGLRCSLLEADNDLLNCMSGVFKLTSLTTLAPLVQANDFVEFHSDSTISSEQVALLRQEAQASGTYYPKADTGLGTVAAGADCLPFGSAGKVIFIEQIGDGTGSCILNTASGATAKALVVGSGGVRVTGGGTYTGIIYALHRTALAGDAADVTVENGSKVVGGVFVDDNDSLPVADRHGKVTVIPPAINMTTVINTLVPLCVPLPVLCGLTSLLGKTLDELMSFLGISATTLAAAIAPQLNASTPAIVYDETAVKKVSTFGDSAVVTGTFRQVAPQF